MSSFFQNSEFKFYWHDYGYILDIDVYNIRINIDDAKILVDRFINNIKQLLNIQNCRYDIILDEEAIFSISFHIIFTSRSIKKDKTEKLIINQFKKLYIKSPKNDLEIEFDQAIDENIISFSLNPILVIKIKKFTDYQIYIDHCIGKADIIKNDIGDYSIFIWFRKGNPKDEKLLREKWDYIN